MLSSKDLHMFREQLLEVMARTDSDRSGLRGATLEPTGGEASGGLSNVPLHMADLGTHQAEEDMQFQLVENEEAVLREVQAALERLDQNTFGRCEDCGKAIARGRLKVLPYTRYCVECAAKVQSGNQRG